MCAEWALVVVSSVYAMATVAMVGALIWAGKTAVKQLEQWRTDSRRELVRGLMKDWTGEELRKARGLLFHELGIGAVEDVNLPKLAKKLKQKLESMEKEDREALSTLVLIPHYFETVSVMVRPDEDTEEARDIMKLFRSTIVFFYDLYEPWITERRKTTKRPRLYEEFQKLCKLAKNDEW